MSERMSERNGKMFERSRRRIILSIMGSLLLLLAVTLSIILFASYREVDRNNNEMLERYVDQYTLDQPAGGQDRPGPEAVVPDKPDAAPGGQKEPGSEPDSEPGGREPGQRPDFQLATFYSVAFDEDGSVLQVYGGNGLYEEDDLVQMAEDLLAENAGSDSSGSSDSNDNADRSGKLDNLRYLIRDKGDYTLVAFIDSTLTDSSLGMVLHNVLIIGGAALLALFFISLYLARRIIRPLEENDARQRRFISDASHELKTPVAVIGANAEMLSRELGENTWLSNIQYENDRMGELVRQLLDLSRAENTDAPVEQVDFSRVATGEVLAFESLAFEQGKTIQSDIAEGVLLSGRTNQLAQLVSILLDNAIHHAEGSEVELALKKQGAGAVLTVANESGPIPAEQQAHLFDRFYRADEARSGEGQHYGLGLAIAKAVAENHGGSIGVSCDGGKVIFTVTLPLKA